MPEVTPQQIEKAIRYYHSRGEMDKVKALGETLMRQVEVKPESPGVAKSFARGVATGIPGFFDLAANLLVKPVLDIPAMVSGERAPRVPAARSAEIAARTLGLPQPQTAGERIAEIAGASSIPGLGAVGMAPRGQKLLTAVTEMASALGAGIGQEAAGTPGMILGGFAPYGTAAILRQSAATGTRAPQQELLETFQRQQVPPTMGDLGVAGPQAMAEKIPGGYGVMKKARESQASAMDRKISQMTEDIDDISTGMTLRSGIAGWVDNQFQPTSRKLYQRLNKYVPDNAPASTINTTRITSEIVEEGGPFASIFTHPAMKQINDKLVELGGNMTFQQLRQLRSAIGRKLSSTDLVSDLPRADLKQLYREISNDIEDTILATGSKPAMSAYNKANNYYKKGIKRVDNFLQPLLGKNVEKVDEEVFKALQRQVKGTPTRAIELGKSLRPADREIVLSGIIKELGIPTDSRLSGTWTFSPDTFLTNLNKIDERAFKSLARNTKYSRLAGQDLKDLKVVAEQIRDSVRYMQNPSGTSQAITSTILGGGAIGGVGTGVYLNSPELIGSSLLLLGTTSGGAWSLAKLMSSPKFVKWVVDGTEMPVAQLGSHLARLGNVSINETSEIQQAIQEYLNLLTNQ